MQVPKVTIHHLPPPPPSHPLPATHGQVNLFHRFIIPFIHLLFGAAGHVMLTTLVTAQYCQRHALAVQTIFQRIIYAPSFDATDPAFKKELEQLENQVPLLQKKIDDLEQKFWQKHLISRDMEEFKKLSDEISRTYRKLDYFVQKLEHRVHPFPIQDQLEQVRNDFRDLDDKIDFYCLNKGVHILNEFQKTGALFSRAGIELPKDIQQQLVKTWQELDAIFKLRLHNQSHIPQAKDLWNELSNIRDMMKCWTKKSKASPAKNEKAVNSVEPLELRNIGNSCYLDSVLQSILCIDHIRDRLSQVPERDKLTSLKDYQKEVAIQQEILQFMNVQQTQKESSQLSQMEFILFLLGGPSLHRLREAIFKSEFHHEFDADSLQEQHDAANIMELLIDHLLADCKFHWRGHATTSVFPGLEFLNGGLTGPSAKNEELAILQIPLRNLPKNQKLDRLVHAILGKHIEKESDPANQRQFDPNDGMVIEGKEDDAALILSANPVKVDQFYEWYRLKQLPPVLTIQFKRFTSALAKDGRPVILPEDGILDLSRYYDAPAGESKKALYRIKSMVRHSGSTLKHGHYIADVEINGKYYHCDDTDPKAFKEISKKDFLGRKDPYLLFLERIPDDEVEKLEEKVIEEPKKAIKSKTKD